MGKQVTFVMTALVTYDVEDYEGTVEGDALGFYNDPDSFIDVLANHGGHVRVQAHATNVDTGSVVKYYDTDEDETIKDIWVTR